MAGRARTLPVSFQGRRVVVAIPFEAGLVRRTAREPWFGETRGDGLPQFDRIEQDARAPFGVKHVVVRVDATSIYTATAAIISRSDWGPRAHRRR